MGAFSSSGAYWDEYSILLVRGNNPVLLSKTVRVSCLSSLNIFIS